MLTAIGVEPWQFLPTRLSDGNRLSAALSMLNVNAEFTVTVFVARSTLPVIGPAEFIEKVALAIGNPKILIVCVAFGSERLPVRAPVVRLTCPSKVPCGTT